MWVKEVEITLDEGKKIYGELNYPEENGVWRTVILFHGSGISDRHATVEIRGRVISQNFKLLSERLVQAGYAVFRYDKSESYDINIIMHDAQEVIRVIKGFSEVSEIFLYGWSEGVRVCVAMASEFPEVKGMILQSGLAEGWSSYFSYILKEVMVEKFEELDWNKDGILELSDFRDAKSNSTVISFSLHLLVFNTDKNGNKNFNKELDPEQKGSFSIQENWVPFVNNIVRNPTALKKFSENAPKENWEGIIDDVRKIKIPMLLIHGLNDGYISPIESVKIAKAARNYADVILFKGLGHSLSRVKSPLYDEGGNMEKESIIEIIKWLKRI